MDYISYVNNVFTLVLKAKSANTFLIYNFKKLCVKSLIDVGMNHVYTNKLYILE